MVTLQSFRSSSQWSKILFQVAPTISKKNPIATVIYSLDSDTLYLFQVWIGFESNHPLWDQMVTLQSTLFDLVHNNQKTRQNSSKLRSKKIVKNWI